MSSGAPELEKQAIQDVNLSPGADSNDSSSLEGATINRSTLSQLTQSEAHAVIDREMRFLLGLNVETWLKTPPSQLKLSIHDLTKAIAVDRTYAIDSAAKYSPHYNNLIQSMLDDGTSRTSSSETSISEAIEYTKETFSALNAAKAQIEYVRHNYPTSGNISEVLDGKDSVTLKLRALSQFFADNIPKTKLEFSWIDKNIKIILPFIQGVEQLDVIIELAPELSAIMHTAIDGLAKARVTLADATKQAFEQQKNELEKKGESVIAQASQTFGHRNKSYYGIFPGIDDDTYRNLSDEQRSRLIAVAVAEYRSSGLLQFRRRRRMRSDMARFLILDIESTNESASLSGRLIEGASILSRKSRKALSETLLRKGGGRAHEEIATAMLDSGAREALLAKMEARDASYRKIRVVQDNHLDSEPSLTEETEQALQELKQ